MLRLSEPPGPGIDRAHTRPSLAALRRPPPSSSVPGRPSPRLLTAPTGSGPPHAQWDGSSAISPLPWYTASGLIRDRDTKFTAVNARCCRAGPAGVASRLPRPTRSVPRDREPRRPLGRELPDLRCYGTRQAGAWFTESRGAGSQPRPQHSRRADEDEPRQVVHVAIRQVVRPCLPRGLAFRTDGDSPTVASHAISADMARAAAGQHGWLRRADLGDLRSRSCGRQVEPAPRRGCPVRREGSVLARLAARALALAEVTLWPG
jgi:hypothetical protein